MKRYELISLTLKDNKTNEIKEVLYDELDIINLLNKQDIKWQKLKGWLEQEIKNKSNIDYEFIQDQTEGQRLVLDKMQELETEDVED